MGIDDHVESSCIPTKIRIPQQSQLEQVRYRTAFLESPG